MTTWPTTSSVCVGGHGGQAKTSLTVTSTSQSAVVASVTTSDTSFSGNALYASTYSATAHLLTLSVGATPVFDVRGTLPAALTAGGNVVSPCPHLSGSCRVVEGSTNHHQRCQRCASLAGTCEQRRGDQQRVVRAAQRGLQRCRVGIL